VAARSRSIQAEQALLAVLELAVQKAGCIIADSLAGWFSVGDSILSK